MTKRQQKLGITETGYQDGIIDGNWMRNREAFEAKAATLKKGQYHGREVIQAWFPAEYRDYDSFIDEKHEACIPFFNAITILHPEAYLYTNTHGLDLLTVK